MDKILIDDIIDDIIYTGNEIISLRNEIILLRNEIERINENSLIRDRDLSLRIIH